MSDLTWLTAPPLEQNSQRQYFLCDARVVSLAIISLASSAFNCFVGRLAAALRSLTSESAAVLAAPKREALLRRLGDTYATTEPKSAF